MSMVIGYEYGRFVTNTEEPEEAALALGDQGLPESREDSVVETSAVVHTFFLNCSMVHMCLLHYALGPRGARVG